MKSPESTENWKDHFLRRVAEHKARHAARMLLLAARERATDRRNWIDVSDLTAEQFADLLRAGTYAARRDEQ